MQLRTVHDIQFALVITYQYCDCVSDGVGAVEEFGGVRWRSSCLKACEN